VNWPCASPNSFCQFVIEFITTLALDDAIRSSIIIRKTPPADSDTVPASTIPTILQSENPSSVPDTGPAIQTIENLWTSTGHREGGGTPHDTDSDSLFVVQADDVADSYELTEYRHIQTSKRSHDIEKRRREKRVRKRAWIETQDEMKFSHSIQFNAVPDWSTHYIAYSNLKKL
jgi:hypothetical protein